MQVDINVLQPLLAAGHLSKLRGKKLEEFTDLDIRSLTLGINKEIANLRNPIGKFMNPRALAQILLDVAQLQFDDWKLGRVNRRFVSACRFTVPRWENT